MATALHICCALWLVPFIVAASATAHLTEEDMRNLRFYWQAIRRWRELATVARSYR